MKSANEMANNLLSRRDNYQRERAAKRKKMAKMTASLCSVCLVMLLGVGLWQGAGMSGRRPAGLPDDGRKETATERTTGQPETQGHESAPAIPMSEDPRVIWSSGESSGQEGLHTWAGKEITFLLWETLDAVGDDAILAFYARPALDDTYVFQGKTLGEYYQAMSREKNMPDCMSQLLKEGDTLKYGTALYETGTPQGERWYKSLYEERVAFYGELLSLYIVDGQFLREKLEQDLDRALVANTEKLAWESATRAWLEDLAADRPGSLIVENDRCLVLFLTKAAFREMAPDGWLTFDLAVKAEDAPGAGYSYSGGDKRE